MAQSAATTKCASTSSAFRSRIFGLNAQTATETASATRKDTVTATTDGHRRFVKVLVLAVPSIRVRQVTQKVSSKKFFTSLRFLHVPFTSRSYSRPDFVHPVPWSAALLHRLRGFALRLPQKTNPPVTQPLCHQHQQEPKNVVEKNLKEQHQQRNVPLVHQSQAAIEQHGSA